MALNNSHAQGGVLIFAGERILIYYDGIEMAFEGPSDVIPMKDKKKGRCYLTTHRVIFNSKDPKDSMQSFSFPFLLMKEVELEQPIFGSNYVKGKIRSEPYGNWTGEAKWKMYFTHGGAIEFGQAMVTAGRLASRNRPPNPPPYYPPPNSGYYNVPPPAYQPPSSDFYAWVPYSTFPSAPPANTVYTHEAPPPYPGVDPSMAYPPSAPMMNGQDAKAQEAAASAYYNPSNQHDFYAPTSQMMAPPAYNYNYSAPPPPSYDEAQKKQN